MKRILILAAVLFTAILIGYLITPKVKKTLPIINPIDLKAEMVDPELLRVGNGHTIAEFSFQNQLGKITTDKDVSGKVFVVEYFFTTCGTICPKMNIQMQRVQKAYLGNENFKILSFTVNPEVDSVAQMKRYADSHGAKSNQWFFLTGDKNKLYEMARKSFFVLKPQEAQNLGGVESDFIHTNNFVLIDRKMRIRGYYDGTVPHAVDQLIDDVQLLLEEE
jgi:protein SCO1/2